MLDPNIWIEHRGDGRTRADIHAAGDPTSASRLSSLLLPLPGVGGAPLRFRKSYDRKYNDFPHRKYSGGCFKDRSEVPYFGSV
jgi:hypothetical protein